MKAVLPGTASGALIRLDEAGLVLSWPDAAVRRFDLDAQLAVGRPIWSVFPAHYRQEWQRALKELGTSPAGTVSSLCLRIESGADADQAVECSIWRSLVETGRPVVPEYDLMVHDAVAPRCLDRGLVDELRELRQTTVAQAVALRALESRLHDLTETIDEVFWIANATITRMLYISPGYERVWGRPCTSLYDNPRSFIDAIHADDRDRVLEGLTVQRDGLPFDHEYRVVRPDGTVVLVWDRGYPVRTPDGAVDRYIGVAQDVTDRRAADAAARRQETLDAIGHMTGGLAHDFNNILSVIVGHLDLMAIGLGDNAPVRESLDRALDAALRGERLAGRLLGLARQEPVERRLVCLAAAIEELRPLLGYAAGASTRLEICALARPGVHIDPGELDGALINLAVNARAAMPNGGDLRITIDELLLTPAAAASHSVRPGTYARVRVADTGCGMSAETLGRLGEPFFTTRRHREGTGLGVPMVHAFVRRSGGVIRVESTPGVGTQFELLLPVAGKAPA